MTAPARRRLRLRPTPLAAALAACLPALAAQAAGPVTLAPPAATAVPVPGASWRTYGSGNSAGPVNLRNTRGGIDQTINQTSQKGIYNWQSFDIGAASSVTFDMALKGASALNRVTGSTSPSQIFGQLKATNGGEVYLINANGILFGKGAVVNTGSLIASGLDITDDNFKSSLVNSITAGADNVAGAVAFQYAGDPTDFIDSRNYVRVDAGATIATESGGRVFLFAKNVDNAGSITTPDGQTALAAGSEVFLRLPTSRLAVYAAESNPNVPVLRGLLVEVGDKFSGDTKVAPTAHGGTVTNEALTGQISTPRGNATLVGLAVNQLGRVSATTSVSANGTIFLRAQGDATMDTTDTQAPFVAHTGGTLTLGPGSVTQILPDTELVNGALPTSNGMAGFIASRIDLQGRTVELRDGAAVVAPGATVNVRAESAPGSTFAAPVAADPQARVVLDAGARIDVSGTTDTVVGVDRYFVTTDLLTSSDLQDAPLQKDGLLYRAKVTLDVRDASLILGDLARYRDNIERTADEQLSAGGKVNFVAQGAVLLAAGSRVDVSGGQIRATGAMVDPTRLVSASGGLYDLNDAPADQVYTLGLNLQKSGLTQYDRWGEIARPGTTTPAYFEPGYVQGAAAGAVTIEAPTVLLNGSLDAHTNAGTRQLAGQDPLAGPGRLAIGSTVGFGGFDNTLPTDLRTLLQDFSVARTAPATDAGLWHAPLTSALPAHSGMATQALADAGFGVVTLSAQGDVSLDTDGELTLADHSALTLESATGQVALAGKLTDRAGSVNLSSVFGNVDVAAGTQVDLSGRWINQFQDQKPEDTSAIVGGSFVARGERGVALGTGSLVDVSGGATVTQAGALVGGNAGAITLLAGRTDQATALAGDPASARRLQIGATLRGQALQSANGAALTLRAPSMRIGSAAPGAAPASLSFTPAFFTRGGFSSFSLDGLAFLDVAAGTTLAPTRTSWWTPDTSYQRAATGSRIGNVLAAGASPLALAPTVDLTLKSSGTPPGTVGGAPATNGGKLTLEADSRIALVPGSALAAQAATQLDVEGGIVDHGGAVALTTLGTGSVDQSNYLWIGKSGSIDVSGTTRLAPSTDGLAHGVVQDGGSITLRAASDASNYATSLVIQDGAHLDLDGTTGVLDVSARTAGGVATTRQSLASQGGRLSITGTSDIALEGAVSMRGGNAEAAGGSLAVTLLGARDDFVDFPNGLQPARLPDLTLAAGRTHATAGLAPDALPSTTAIATRNAAGTSNAVVSAQWVHDAGAADLELDAAQTLKIAGDVTLAMPRSLVVDAASLAVDSGAHATLGGAITVVGNARVHADPNISGRLPADPLATAGTGTLALRGDDLVIDGRLTTQQVGQLTLSATNDLRLQASLRADANSGALTSAGDIAIQAGQVWPATAQQFAIAAPGHDITIARADAQAAPPLSAGGSLSITAATIEQDGVLRAPFGSITLAATDKLTLGAHGETSISGAGLTVSYGSTSDGGTSWGVSASGSAPQAISALPGKTLSLTAPAVTTSAGAKVDLGGGGTVVGYEFIPGPGGSRDVFAGGDGAYAIVPGVQGAAPYDPAFTGQATLGEQLIVGPGAPIPAGRYTLLPARYALLPGAFLVKPAAGTPLADGTTIANADGSALIGARTGSAGTDFASASASTWRVQTREQALKSSEIRITDADTFFAGLAAKNGTATPRGAADGGVLQFSAGAADLAGSFRFDAARDASGAPTGLGGVAAFSADRIVVASDGAPRTPGTLTLSASQLDAMAPATLLLGATVGTGTAAGTLGVVASDIRFANADHALTVGDLIATATDRVEVLPGAAIVAGAPATGGVTAPPAAAFAISGDGAALRVSNQSGASLSRTAGARTTGTLQVDAGARIDAGAGSLVLDGTLANTIAGDARLHAGDITLAAGRVLVGNGSAADSLVLGAGLLGQVDNAAHLTLRGYDRIAFLDDSRLGGDALASVTLDTGRLLAFDADASVSAGEIALTNTTGVAQALGSAGSGSLTLHADGAQGSGHLLLEDGALSVNGVQTTTLQADHGLVLAGDATLATGGDLVVRAPRVFAQAPTSKTTTVAGVTLNAPGTVNFIANTPGQGADAEASAIGAALSVKGARIFQGTTIDLPSGQLDLAATNGSNGDVSFTATSHTNLAGGTRTIDGSAVSTGGGALTASALAGDVVVSGGAAIDVSAAADAAGGSVSLSAAQGRIDLSGTLRGSAGDPVRGARLRLDAAGLPSLDSLAALQQAASGNFSGALDLRQRGAGSLVLDAGRTLAANAVAIEVDAGALTVAGRIDAGGADAGSIDLSARDALALQARGQLLAHATGSDAAGGRVALTSSQGRLALAAGSTIDVGSTAARTDADIQGGRLTLRAERIGNDVAIDTIGASVLGASAIDVQAVKVFDGIARLTSDDSDTRSDSLRASAIASDSLAFVGATGANADAIAHRLAAGNAGLLADLRVHAEAEVRSTGGLSISTPTAASGFESDDFVLPTESADLAATSRHVGDTSLTLRAAGDVALSRTISAGFAPVYSGFDVRATPRTSEHSGNVRIVAGADFGAASAMATIADQGTIALGRSDEHGIPFSATTNIVAVRATTGDVRFAAGKDIDMRSGRSLVYTTGRDVKDATAAAVRDANFIQDGSYAFTVGAGDVSMNAQGSVLASDTWRDPNQSVFLSQEFAIFRSPIQEQVIELEGQALTADAWMTGAATQFVPQGVQHGVVSFGGGRVDIAAGQDVWNVEAVSPSTGYVLHDADGKNPVTRILPGGDVHVRAGRDLVNGMFETGGRQITVDAGRDVAWRASPVLGVLEPGARLLTENATLTATARRDLTFAYTQAALQVQDQSLTGLDGDASANVQAAGGDVHFLATNELTPGGYGTLSIVVPAQTRITAPSGSLTLGDIGNFGFPMAPESLAQHPVDAARFDLLAGDSLTDIGRPGSGGPNITITSTPDLTNGPRFVSLAQDPTYPATALDESDRTGVHLAAASGDLVLGNLTSARPVRIAAGRDLTLQGVLQVTQQPDRLDGPAAIPVDETSSLQAGRDLRLDVTGVFGSGGPVKVAGPGEFLVLAGRDIDLGHGSNGNFDVSASGIVATGNAENIALPANAAANITLVAGLRADGSDYGQATLAGFEAIGANALTDHAGDLYAQLTAPAGGAVALGTAAARAFDGAPLDSQLAQVQTLLGASTYDARLAAYVRSLPGESALTDAQALAAFAGLSAPKRAAAPGVLLASSFEAQPQATRTALVAEIAAATPSSYGAALVDYMAKLDGRSRSVAQAITDFESLPLLSRMPLLDSVLVAELRVNGRAAAASTGSAQEDAYDRGYRTLATLFPGDRPDGSITLPEAEVKTVQQAGITLLAPGGSANAGGIGGAVGELAIAPNNLGIVTVAGGDIAAVARDDFLVNRSRVFTLENGDLLIWSSQGNIDAGRGAKTVVGAPAPVLRIDANTGKLFLDTSGSFTGSGIAVLDPKSALDLYAPAGAIDAGEAGIKSAGNAYFAAQTFLGADNLQVGGQSVGAPPPVTQAGATARLADAGNVLAGAQNAVTDEDREQRRKRRTRRNLLLEFLGFGSASN